MNRKELEARLAAGEVVPLSAARWRSLAAGFEVVEDLDTFLAGRILLIRRPVAGKARPGWAVVEDPEPKMKVVRPLATEQEARALIADRLAAYERMWDG